MRKVVGFCSVPDCESAISVKLLCAKHYAKLLRYGDPLANPQHQGEPMAWIKTVVAEVDGDGCRDWPYSTGPKGYGQVRVNGELRPSGHLVLELTGQPRPAAPNDNQLHSCDRPVCSAPWHLRWGNNDENHAESVERGRSSRGEHRPAAKLTEDIVRDLRAGRTGKREAAIASGASIRSIEKALNGQTWRHI